MSEGLEATRMSGSERWSERMKYGREGCRDYYTGLDSGVLINSSVRIEAG